MDTRLRGVPALTDVTWDVGKALLASDKPLTVAELMLRTGRCDGSVRRVLADMEDKNWVQRCTGRREDVPVGSHLCSYTGPGKARAEKIFGCGIAEQVQR